MANNKIIENICGKQDNSNLPKASFDISTGIFIESSQETSEISSFGAIKPVIEIERHGSFIVCDLVFISGFDNDIKSIYSILELYGSNATDNNVNEYVEGDARLPYLVVMLSSLVGKDCSITLSSPIMWCLTSNKPGTMPNTIRLLFMSEDVLLYEGDDDDFVERKTKEIEEEMNRTAANAAYFDRVEEARKKDNK